MEKKMNIGIAENNRKQAANQLSALLADEYLLFTQTKQAHWNVEGLDFYNKHKLFEEQANELATIIDDVAERIRTLGFPVPATLGHFLELTHLKEHVAQVSSSQELIGNLLTTHETIIRQLRSKIDLFSNEFEDMGTSDFVTGLMKAHEKTAWILRAHLI